MSSLTTAFRWMARSRPWPDLVVALIIFAFAAFWGAKFVTSGEIPPKFYQSRFTPAVMEACGKGFVQPDSRIPALTEFLRLKQSDFSCDQIPDRFEKTPPNKMQQASRYLMGAVALNWRLTGVSWNSLIPLYALLFGISGAAFYGVFRLGMGKSLAAMLATFIVLSPLQLNNLPHLRDYAKAPFIIAIVLLLGWLVKYPLDAKKTVLLGVLVGAILGVGIGFRMDLLIFIPAVLITLAAFTPSGLTRAGVTRVCAAGAFVCTFVALGWPALAAFGGGSNTFHVILLGLFSPFDQPLNIQPSPVYEWGHLRNDAYTNHVLSSYAHRILHVDTPIRLATHAYEQAGMAYYLEILRQFPADIATRFLAAGLKIVQTTGFEGFVPWAGRLSILALLASLVILAAYDLRVGIFAGLAVLYLSGYPALQFHSRHFFHLQMVPLFFFGFLVQTSLSKGRQLLEQRAESLPNLQLSCDVVKRVSLFLLLATALVGSFFGLRAYQQTNSLALLKKYEQLPFANSDIEVLKTTDKSVHIRPSAESSMPGSDLFPIRTGYWRLEVDNSECTTPQIAVQIRYRRSGSSYNASRLIMLDTRSPLHYLFHTYSFNFGNRYSVFEGLEINEDDFSCITRFGRLAEFEQLPLLMNLTFSEGWANEQIYQTIGREAVPKVRRVGVTTFTFPKDLVVSRAQVGELLTGLKDSTTSMRVVDENVSIVDGKVTFKGDAPTPFYYVLKLPAEKTSGERYLIAEGDLIEGGLTIGLLRENRWAGQINVTTPGKFRIVMRPENGEYTATLAHNVPGRKLNHFNIDKLGWSDEPRASDK